MPDRHRLTLRTALMSRSSLVALSVVAAANLAGTAAQASNIDKSQAYYLASNLGKSVDPDFKGGTLRIDASTSLSQNFAVEDVAGNTVDAYGHNATFSGVLSGAGDITFADSIGGGTSTLTGSNTYTGTTTINGGTLALSGGGSISTSDEVVNEGTFDISGTTSGASIVSLTGTASSSVVLGIQNLTITSGSANFAGVISGTGKLVMGGGAEYLSGENTYTGGTTISSGTLYIGAGGTSGSIAGDVLDNGTLAFNRTDTITLTNNISGTGGLSQTAAGTLIVTSAQAYTGATTITAGTLTLSGAGSLASSSGIADNATFDISGANGTVSIKSLGGTGTLVLGANTLTVTAGSATFFGAISGDGGLVVSGGTQVLGGTNTYAGGTTVTAGVLKLGAGGSTGTVVGNIVDNGTVAFNFSSAVLDASIIGSGAVVQAGTGITMLTAAQSYTGTTTISAGTLALSQTASIASSSGLVDNGSFDISAMTSAVSVTTLSGSGKVSLGSQTLILTGAIGTFSGALTGTGGLQVSGGGETFLGASSYSGVTVVSAGASLNMSGNGSIGSSSRVQVDGTVDISASTRTNSVVSLNGSGTVSLGAQTLTLSNAADTFAGSLTGNGGIALNAGTETLTGNNTYLGSTTIYAATLKLVGSGSIAPSSGIVGYGTFDISGTTSGAQVASLSGSGSLLLGTQNLTLTAGGGATYTGVISGTGGLIVTGGTQILAGSNTYTGGTTIGGGGILQLGGGSNGGSIAGNVADNGTLAFNLPNGSFSGVISGTGSVNEIGGTTILLAANTYSGGTTISNGVLQLGNGGTTGSIQGNVSDNGSLVFNRSDTVSFDSAISGTGGVAQNGAGTLILTATNTYTGQTSIASGTLVLNGNGSIADSSQIVDNGVLDVSAISSNVVLKSLAGTGTVSLGSKTLTLAAASGSFNGTISGTGGVTLTGGTQTLGGDNSFSGLTSVNAGTLLIDGRTTSTQGVKVASGGVLGGTGTVASVTVANGGKISAGDAAVGTLHVAGSLQLGSASITNVNVSEAGASELIVSNAATLGGTLTVTNTGGFAVGQKWTVLTAAGGVTGNLTLATTKSTAGNFLYALSQDANSVYLQINLANLSSLLPATANANERAVSGGIDAAITSGATLPAALEQLGNLSGATLTSTIDALSGEIGADVAQAGVQAQAPFVATMFDRMDFADAMGTPGAGRTWTDAYGGAGKITGDATAGSHALGQGAWGLAGGAEWDLSRALTAGVAVSYGRSTVRLAGNLGTGAVNAYQLGGYALMRWSSHLYGSLAITLGADRLSSHRVASTDTLEGSATALTFGARYETGVHFSWGTPYAALQGIWFNAPAYDEDVVSGPGTFALHYDAHTNNQTHAELGLKEVGHIKIGDGILRLSGQLAWAHDFTNTTNALAVFRNVSNSGFVVQGARQAPDAGLLSLGTGFTTASGLDLHLSFDTAISRNSQSYSGNAGVVVRW